MSWGRQRSGANPGHVPNPRDPAPFHQVIEDVIARIIDVAIDLMRCQVPGLERKANANVSADLTDPDRFACKPEFGRPQAQVQPFVDRFPRLLESEVLATASDVKRTHRG